MVDPIFMLLGLIFGWMLDGWSKESLVKRKVTKARLLHLSAMLVWCSVLVVGLISIRG